MTYETFHDRLTGRTVLQAGPDPYGASFALILPREFDPLMALESIRDWFDDWGLTTAPAEWFEDAVIAMAKASDGWCRGT